MAKAVEPKARFQMDAGLEVWKVAVDDVREQSKNARTMDPHTFKRLTKNVEKGGRLESLPFCALTKSGGLDIISGHHRVRSARDAGLTDIYVLVDVTILSRSAVVAKQLAHNAISGTDDPSMLAELYADLKTVDDQIESHIDPEKLGISAPSDLSHLQEVRVAFDVKTVTFTFLPTDLEDFMRAADAVSPASNMVGVLPVGQYEKFREAMKQLGKTEDIHAVGAIVSRMTELTLEWVEAQRRAKEAAPDPAEASDVPADAPG